MNVNSDDLPPIRLSRSETKARTRATLLAAAARVFAANGFHGATVENIAEAAGFTRGAFYANFADKADLLLTLLDERSHADLADLEERLDADGDQFGLTAVASWFAQTFSAPSPLDAAVAEFIPVAMRDPAHHARIRQRMHDVRDRVAAIVEAECVRAGFELPIPPETFAVMIVALVDGFVGLYRVDPEAAPADLLAAALRYLGEGVAANH
jgi:AcrR family transcriptional regulator